jgi:hypothetical protein
MEMAATEKALVYASHCPVPSRAHFDQQEGGWQWQPIETAG